MMKLPCFSFTYRKVGLSADWEGQIEPWANSGVVAARLTGFIRPTLSFQ